MSDLIIAAYGSQRAAFLAGESLAALQQESGVVPEDIVVITRSPLGRLSVNQSTDLATGDPLGGGGWGTVIGLLFADPRAAAPDGRGLAAQLVATGLDPVFLRDVAVALDQTVAVVGLRVRMLGLDRVRDRLGRLQGDPKILTTRLSAATEEALYDMQDQIPSAVLDPVRSGGPS